MMTTGLFILLFTSCAAEVSADEGSDDPPTFLEDESEIIEEENPEPPPSPTPLSENAAEDLKEEIIETLAATETQIETMDEKTEDLKNNMVALEIFLKDQEDYEKFCPKKKWTQPEMIEYKKKLRSMLPEDCLPEEEKKLREKLQRQEEETVEVTEE